MRWTCASIWSRRRRSRTAQVKLEYLTTLQGDLEPPQAIDAASLIFNVKEGWAEGPRFKGKLLAPAADWLQILPSGAWRLDVRATMLTDDEQMSFVSYNGVITLSCATKVASGSPLTHADVSYFAIAPTFRTAAEKYSWLNGVQAVTVALAPPQPYRPPWRVGRPVGGDEQIGRAIDRMAAWAVTCKSSFIWPLSKLRRRR